MGIWHRDSMNIWHRDPRDSRLKKTTNVINKNELLFIFSCCYYSSYNSDYSSIHPNLNEFKNVFSTTAPAWPFIVSKLREQILQFIDKNRSLALGTLDFGALWFGPPTYYRCAQEHLSGSHSDKRLKGQVVRFFASAKDQWQWEECGNLLFGRANAACFRFVRLIDTLFLIVAIVIIRIVKVVVATKGAWILTGTGCCSGRNSRKSVTVASFRLSWVSNFDLWTVNPSTTKTVNKQNEVRLNRQFCQHTTMK